MPATTGMLAFALWDREERTLYLVLNRMGENQIYYGWQNSMFLFKSEFKALAAHPTFARDVDREVLPLLLQNDYIPSSWS